jgi:hypothetical protein
MRFEYWTPAPLVRMISPFNLGDFFSMHTITNYRGIVSALGGSSLAR